MIQINMMQMVIKALVVAATIMINVKLASLVSPLAVAPTVDEVPIVNEVLEVTCDVVIGDDDEVLEVLSTGGEETDIDVEVVSLLLDKGFEVDTISLDELLEGDTDAILLEVSAAVVVSI